MTLKAGDDKLMHSLRVKQGLSKKYKGWYHSVTWFSAVIFYNEIDSPLPPKFYAFCGPFGRWNVAKARARDELIKYKMENKRALQELDRMKKPKVAK